MANSLDKVLREAVSYIAAHGFDNSPQMQIYIAMLREAASASMISESAMIAQMRASLEQRFKRALTPYAVNRLFRGRVATLNIDNIRPDLQDELARRIMANAELIKLNRQQAIDKVSQRFAGWMTSVPIGGSREIDTREVVKDISKSAKQLRFEINRRNIDQGHKLVAAVNATMAKQSNAIAAIWRSRWRRPNYDYREPHKALDGKVFAIRDNWAIVRGLMTKGDGFVEDMVQPAQEPYCSCSWEYIIGLRGLPESMLTAKGRESLEAK